MSTLRHVAPELNMDSTKVFARSTHHSFISEVVRIFKMSPKALGMRDGEQTSTEPNKMIEIVARLNDFLDRNDYLGLFKYAVGQFASCDPQDRNLKSLFRNLVIGMASNMRVATDLFVLRESITKIWDEFDKLATRETEKVQPVSEM